MNAGATLQGLLTRRRSVKSLLQSEISECGLACLAMVANYHRHKIDVSYLRALFPVTQAGMTFADIVELASSLGLDATGYALGSVDELETVTLPAILHWKGVHFVVLEKITKAGFFVHDPAFGLRIYNRDDMERLFSGVVLEFAPRLDFQKLKSERKLTLLEIMRSCEGLGATVQQVALVSVAIALLGLATPILLEVALDVVIPQVDLDLLNVLALGLGAMMIFEACGRWLRDYITLRSSTLMQLQLARSTVGHAFRLPLNYFEARHPGDFAARIESIDHIKTFLVTGVVTSIADSLTSILIIGLMFYYSPLMAIVTLLTLAAVLVMRVVTFPSVQRATSASLEAKSEEQARLIDGLRRADSLKAHNSGELFIIRWFESFGRFASMDFRSRKATIDAELFIHLVIVVSSVLTLYMGVREVIDKSLTIGMLYAFFSLRGVFFERLNMLSVTLLNMSMMRVHFGRLDDIIGHEPEPDVAEIGFDRRVRREVRLDKLSMRFGRADEPLLRDINLKVDVAAGEAIAIVGPSGSGKSTLIKILASLQEPTSGGIAIDGTSLSQFGKREYRANIGVVFADDGLFSGTVADNLSLFDPAVTRRDMERALAQVGLSEEIDRLPQGYASLVSEESALLSTGQRRRLLVARALCKRPNLLLLDEITANLDPATERALIASLKTVPAAKVFVTHSHTLLGMVDRTLRISGGTLVAETSRSLTLSSALVGAGAVSSGKDDVS